MNKILKFAPLALALGALVGCAPSQTGESEEIDGKVHVKFWHTMGQANQALLDRMITTFEEANPDIVIEEFSQGGYDDIAKKLGDAIPAGTTPTMSFCYPDNVASYIEAGAVEDMSSYVSNEEYGMDTSDYVSAYWNEGNNYGQQGLYSVPYAKSTEVMFYNATVFAEKGYQVPTTWDEMWSLCNQMKADFPSLKAPLGYDSDSNLFITMCEQNGIPYTTKEGGEGDHYIFDNAQAKAMVTELKAKYDAKLLVTKGSLPNATYTSTMFTNAEVLMSIGSTGGTTYNKSLNFDIGVAPIPAGKNNRHVISQGPSICFFSRCTKAQKVAAWKFYKHITNAENSANFAIETGYEPVRNSSYQTPAFLNYMSQGQKTGNAYIANCQGGNLLATAANCTKECYENQYFTSDVFDGSDAARDAVGGILANVFLKDMSVDDAFSTAVTSCLF